MRYCMARMFVCCLCLVLFSTIGCKETNGRKPVTGIVTLDGQPLDGAEIMLIPQTGDLVDSSRKEGLARSEPGGKFVLRTLGGDNPEGILPGEYVVTVSKTEMYDTGKTRASEVMYGQKEPIFSQREAVPIAYKDAKTSPLKVTIEQGKTNHLTLELKSGK